MFRVRAEIAEFKQSKLQSFTNEDGDTVLEKILVKLGHASCMNW